MGIDKSTGLLYGITAHNIFYDVVGMAQSGIDMLQQPAVRLSIAHPLQTGFFLVRSQGRVYDSEKFLSLVKYIGGYGRRLSDTFQFVPDVAFGTSAFATGIDKVAQIVPVFGGECGLEQGAGYVKLAAQMIFKSLRTSPSQTGIVGIRTLRRGISMEGNALYLETLVEQGIVDGRLHPLQFFGIAAVGGIYGGLIDREVQKRTPGDATHLDIFSLWQHIWQPGYFLKTGVIYNRGDRNGLCLLPA